MGLDSLRFQQQMMQVGKPSSAGPKKGAGMQSAFGASAPKSPPPTAQPQAPIFAAGVSKPQQSTAVKAPQFASNFDSGMTSKLAPGVNPAGVTPNMQGGASVPGMGGQFNQVGKKLNLYA